MTQNADPLSGLAPKRDGKAPRIDPLIRKVGAQTLVANSEASKKPQSQYFSTLNSDGGLCPPAQKTGISPLLLFR
jgi:hypothetical protein